MKVRKATNEDVELIKYFILKSDTYHYETCKTFKDNIDKNPNKYKEQTDRFIESIGSKYSYLLIENNIPIGTIMVWDNNGETTLVNFYINEQYRNRGYGTYLLSYVIKNMNTDYCVLSVFEENIKSLEFYYHYGFKYLQTEKTDSGNLLWLVYNKIKEDSYV